MKKFVIIAVVIVAVAVIAVKIFLPTSKTADVEVKKTPPNISVAEKKSRFKATVIPAVDKVYANLMQDYHAAENLINTAADNDKLATLRTEYKAQDNAELLMALKPHPKSIAIAQAAMESSWATSRFFREANNIFGVWSFNQDEPRIAAGEQRGDKTIWIKKYGSVEDSVRDYYRTIARGSAYKEFRQLKMETDDPYELVKKLDRYSEIGAEYGNELTAIIRFNKFTEYDQQHNTL